MRHKLVPLVSAIAYWISDGVHPAVFQTARNVPFLTDY